MQRDEIEEAIERQYEMERLGLSPDAYENYLDYLADKERMLWGDEDRGAK